MMIIFALKHLTESATAKKSCQWLCAAEETTHIDCVQQEAPTT